MSQSPTARRHTHSADNRDLEVPASLDERWRFSAPSAATPSNPITASPNLDWVEDVRVNTSAVERRAQSLVTRRTVKKALPSRRLLRAISCMDPTTLSGDDERVRRPLRQSPPTTPRTSSQNSASNRSASKPPLCVYHVFVETAAAPSKRQRHPSSPPSQQFPRGVLPLAERVQEIRRSEAGADEIDVVITRPTSSPQNGKPSTTRSPPSNTPAPPDVILGTGDLHPPKHSPRQPGTPRRPVGPTSSKPPPAKNQ